LFLIATFELFANSIRYNKDIKISSLHSLSTMSFYTLNERIKIDYWTEFKAVIAEAKEIADTVRTEQRRVNKPITTTIVVYKIKDIIAPLSRIFNYRYKDDLLCELLTSVVQGLHRLALEIESFYETRFVAEFRRLATTLVSFLDPGEGVQLTLFDTQTYHDPQASKKRLPGFWAWWNNRLHNRLGFSNPYKNTTIAYTQLSIKGLWQRHDDVKMDFIRRAYFDEPQKVRDVDGSLDKQPTSTIEFNNVGLRQLRKVASSLGIQQKVAGKDRSKASFIEELQGLIKHDSASVLAAYAAISSPLNT
jgi:hypothetical protein